MSRSGAAADPALAWVLERMPHAPPMRLIDGVVAVDGPAITCTASVGPGHVLLTGGSGDEGVPGLIAIELFAQAAAALLVFHAARDEGAATSGYLLGTRKLTVDVPRFRPGDQLVVHVTESFSQGPIAQFAGRLERAGVEVARGSINVVHAAGPPPS